MCNHQSPYAFCSFSLNHVHVACWIQTRHANIFHSFTNKSFACQGPPVVSAASKRKKGDKSKGKSHSSSIGELLVIPFLSKFSIPSHDEDASSIAVQK
jgi:hypothetical protein